VRELLRLVVFSVAENFGYRQLITGYRIRGVFAYLRGDQAWGEIRRVGFAQTPGGYASTTGNDA
jgi:hypothetical protein